MSTAGGAWRAALITVSDTRARGEAGEDPSGDLAAERLAQLPAVLSSRRLVADSVREIRAAVSEALEGADLIVLVGGTGLGPRDVTPQALVPLLDYEVPGMAETMRREGTRSTRLAMLSRQVAGVAGGRLVLALPGSPRAVAESLDAVWEALPHALALLRGETAHRG
jgi:molybdenum cofactor synthesis domain-containing protein